MAAWEQDVFSGWQAFMSLCDGWVALPHSFYEISSSRFLACSCYLHYLSIRACAAQTSSGGQVWTPAGGVVQYHRPVKPVPSPLSVALPQMSLPAVVPV